MFYKNQTSFSLTLLFIYIVTSDGVKLTGEFMRLFVQGIDATIQT